MAKVYDTIARALRLLRVVDARQALSASDLSTGIVALNAMMQRWEADTLALGWSPVSSPDDALPVPQEAEEAVAYNLAVRLRPEYGATLEPDVVQMARDGLDALLRDQIRSTPLERARLGIHYNIRTDSYQ